MRYKITLFQSKNVVFIGIPGLVKYVTMADEKHFNHYNFLLVGYKKLRFAAVCAILLIKEMFVCQEDIRQMYILWQIEAK